MRARRPFLLDARAAWVAWACFFVAVALYVTLRPGRPVSGGYEWATRGWWASEEIYGPGPSGFLYLPPFTLLYTPFAWGPAPFAMLAWRLAGLALLATGLRRLCGRDGGPPEAFTLATLLSLAATWAATKTGQANLPLAGALVHAAVDLSGRHWWRAAWLLALALVLKPSALAVVLVVAVVWPRTSWRLAVAIGVALAAAFLHPDPEYVVRTYGAAWEKIRTASQPGERPFDDLVGMLRTAGFRVPEAAKLPLLAVASLGALALSWLVGRRVGPRGGPVAVFAFLAAWTMLFSPRTETNTYVVLVPWVAHAAVAAWFAAPRLEGGFLALLALLLGCDVYGKGIHLATVHWLKPLVALTFLAWWGLRFLAPRRAGPRPP